MMLDSSRVATWSGVGAGALFAGIADLVFAMGFWWLAHRVSPKRILQSIACGWFGDASYEGGMQTACIGAVSHFAIMFAFFVAYREGARHWPVLGARPLSLGAIYGLGLYGVMNFIVLLLSAAGMPSFDNAAWVSGSLAMHAIIGVMSIFMQRQPTTFLSASRTKAVEHRSVLPVWVVVV